MKLEISLGHLVFIEISFLWTVCFNIFDDVILFRMFIDVTRNVCLFVLCLYICYGTIWKLSFVLWKQCQGSHKTAWESEREGIVVYICVYVDYLRTLWNKTSYVYAWRTRKQALYTFRDKFIAQLHSQTKTRQLRGRN